MATTLPKLDPRVKRTRELLQRAFLELIAERGFRAITVQDIAERATVNRATFYAHFDDKYALMDSIVREQFRQALAGQLPAGAGFTQGNLHALVRTVFEFLAGMEDRQCRSAGQAQFEPLVETAVQEELHAFIGAWLKQLPPATAPQRATRETIATALSWAIFGAGVRWSRGTRELPADALARQLVAVLIDGVPRALGVAERVA
jgi:AcrR family transcriptional regulator